MSEKYQIKSEIEHILDRPGMYVGSVYDNLVPTHLYKPSEHRMVLVENSLHNAALQKLFDEILSNAVDEHRRSDAMFKISEISVYVSTSGYVCILDNGGIPVAKHPQASKAFGRDILIPELIFGHLRTSSNYDDTQDREVVGTNGLGAKLTNIFSKEFTVFTCDGKQKVTIKWLNNMRSCELGLVEKASKSDHRTSIEFTIDLERFDIEELNLSHIRQMQKRCIDAAAANPGLKVSFKSDIADGKLDADFKFTSFGEYSRLYFDELQPEEVLTFIAPKLQLNLITRPSNYNVAFVNGALCSNGTHIKVIQKQITDKILEFCKKNDMELITERDILNTLTIFASCTVRNPSYDSQTKTTLTTKLSRYDLKLDDKFLKSLLDSNIIQALRDYYEHKYAAEKRKETRKLNAALRATKVSKKLIICNSKSNNKELLIFEGNSASAGFRKFRNPQTQSAYMLRGKIRNAFNLERAKILENTELREIIALLGLQFDNAKSNIKNLEYDKIIIYSDADQDGGHIAGLLIAFITRHFPELIRNGKVYRAITPIIVAYNNKTKDKKYFYTQEEFDAYGIQNLKGYEIRYTKGLGGLDDNDYDIILNQQKLIRFDIKDAEDIEMVQVWFDKDSTERKKLLLDDNNDTE